jgi:lipoate-protein ligase A
MTPLRIIDTGVKPARWNIAVTAALTELHRAGTIPDTFRFHRYPRAVLLGRHQSLEGAIHADRCVASGVEIARRVTGGGAVYMSPGVLAWDLVINRTRFGRNFDEASEFIGSVFVKGLRRLGLAAQFRAPNDIIVDGRKVSGSSGAFDGPTLIHQGTVVLAVDRSEMASVLRARHGEIAPAARVANLAEFLGRVPAVDEVKDALVIALRQALGVAVQHSEYGTDEAALAEMLLANEIGTQAFVTGADEDIGASSCVGAFL